MKTLFIFYDLWDLVVDGYIKIGVTLGDTCKKKKKMPKPTSLFSEL